MELFKKPGLIIAILALIGLGSYILREIFPKTRTEIVVRDTTITLYDTVWLDKVQIVRAPAKIETLVVSETTWIASIDTILAPYSDTLGVWYYFPPINAFDVLFRPSSRPVEFKTVYRDTVIYKITESPSNFWGSLAEHAVTFLVGYGLAEIRK